MFQRCSQIQHFPHFCQPSFATSEVPRKRFLQTFPFLVLFGRPFYLFPLTLKFNAILTGLSSLLNTYLDHLSAFAFAAISIDTIKPSIVINSLVFFLFIYFTSHMALNIDLSILLKIATSLSFRRHVALPYSMAECTNSDKLFPSVVMRNIYHKALHRIL